MIVKVNIFYTQAHTFHDAQSATVYNLGDEFICSCEVGDEALDLIL